MSTGRVAPQGVELAVDELEPLGASINGGHMRTQKNQKERIRLQRVCPQAERHLWQNVHQNQIRVFFVFKGFNWQTNKHRDEKKKNPSLQSRGETESANLLQQKWSATGLKTHSGCSNTSHTQCALQRPRLQWRCEGIEGVLFGVIIKLGLSCRVWRTSAAPLQKAGLVKTLCLLQNKGGFSLIFHVIRHNSNQTSLEFHASEFSSSVSQKLGKLLFNLNNYNYRKQNITE